MFIPEVRTSNWETPDTFSDNEFLRVKRLLSINLLYAKFTP